MANPGFFVSNGNQLLDGNSDAGIPQPKRTANLRRDVAVINRFQ